MGNQGGMNHAAERVEALSGSGNEPPRSRAPGLVACTWFKSARDSSL